MNGDLAEILPVQARAYDFEKEEIILKPNFNAFPFYVNYDGSILVETSHVLFKQATDFLIAIAEPISRPKHIHEYRLTGYSLYAAVIVGLGCDEILCTLDVFSKNCLPKSVMNFVRESTKNVGKVKLLVQRNVYYFVCANDCAHLLEDPVLRRFLKNGRVLDVDRVRRRCVFLGYPPVEEFDFRSNLGPPEFDICFGGQKSDSGVVRDASALICDKETNNSLDFDPAMKIQDLKNAKDYPVQSRNDPSIPDHDPLKKSYLSGNPTVAANMSGIQPIGNQEGLCKFVYPTYASFQIDLKPSVSIRSYQETCLNKMFSSGRARSGIIVLPCGAGKTLVGITAITTMKHPTLILCTSGVSVEQWKNELLKTTTISPDNVCAFTADRRDAIANVTITTYTMLAYTGKRARDAQKGIDAISNMVWGLLILDEVHVVPATMFRRVVSLKHYAKLGLTATLVREDARIEDLHFLIGPKLFEADWQALCAEGHIARVSCFEVWCKMTPIFFAAYLKSNSNKRRVLGAMNPTKFQATACLIKKHEALKDKIIVFSDNVFALKMYATKLKRPFIYGPTGQPERMRILKQFQISENLNTIFLSKVGDTSIDLPEATVLIQISSHFGSRRQEAQRLGRILRAKRRNDPGFFSHFYTLVSYDTDEMYYAAKRQQFLVNQGYSFEVITDLQTDVQMFRSSQEQKELLASILATEDAEEQESDEWVRKEITQSSLTYVDKRPKRSKK